jgi:glycosyltransferase involved in cell wall biosynthesis
LRVLQTEGPAAVRDRVLDRLADARRDRAYVPLSETDAASFQTPVLNLLATLPSPRLGGVPTQLLARLRFEERQRTVALLYPTGGGYRLEVTQDLRRGRLDMAGSALDPTTLADAAFEAAVLGAVERVGARVLHPEGLAGLPLESLLRLRGKGLKLVLSVHDFALFCARPHLMERPAERFCDYCRDLDRCQRCLAVDWRLPEAFQARRRALSAELLASAEAVVYPSSFLRDRHADLFAGLDPTRQHVIAPAVELPVLPSRGGGPRSIRHVAYVGAVHAHKGALVFEEVVKALASTPGLRFTVFGGGDPSLLARLRRLPRVTVRGYYRAGSLPSLLRQEGVDLALLLSIWPESYGITLEECHAAGVPVVAFDLGAMGERVRREGYGTVVGMEGGAGGVAQAITAFGAGWMQQEGASVEATAADRASPRESAAAILRLYSEGLW